MTVHLYFSVTPESLIASMLPPEEFGRYLAVGRMLKIRGQAIFFRLDPDFRDEYFDIEAAIQRCVPHPDGTPKASVYISSYRVLEHIPNEAIESLYLVTASGHVLELEYSDTSPASHTGLHLYQELAPVTSLVASVHAPLEFCRSITSNPVKLLRFPALCFVELRLDALANNPESGLVGELPYPFISHLRECLLELDGEKKQSKMVNRLHSIDFPYRVVEGGFYVGRGSDLKFFLLPSHAELRSKHRVWWHSANRPE